MNYNGKKIVIYSGKNVKYKMEKLFFLLRYYEEVTKKEIERKVQELRRQWEVMQKKAEAVQMAEMDAFADSLRQELHFLTVNQNLSRTFVFSYFQGVAEYLEEQFAAEGGEGEE